MAHVASKVPFRDLTKLLEIIDKKSGTEEKKRVLRTFIDKWRNVHQGLHGDKQTEDSFYGAMRLLLPQLEREREAYGIKEHTLAKLYIEILGLGKDSPSAQKLLNYRAPKTAKGDVGDFASVAYWVLKPRCPDKGTMTVEEVNKCLDGVANANTLKDKPAQKKHLCDMLKNMTAEEQKWLIRIIMKELKMGLSQQSIFNVFHQDAEDVFNVKMSLHKVCTMLKDPSVRMHEIEVSLFSPFRPMLGDRGKPNQVEKTMDGKPYIIETKFDGERMQLHKDSDEYKYFSRGGNDYTHIFGANMWDGNFTPRASNCWKDGVESLIIDGEMIPWDPETETRASKGENVDIKSANLTAYQPMLCVFDILMLNGEILSNKPLRQRKEILSTVFEPIEGTIMLSEWKEGKTNQDCINALNDAIDGKEEGIMVKMPESAYKPNTRKGGWYKIKPEYVNNLMDELDVLVVGGYFGVGHRSGMMSHFLCAVADKEDGEDKPKKFHSFCKVGSGYSRKELYEFNRKMKDDWIPFERKRVPTWLQLAPGLKQRPDATIEPSKSYIVQIKAAEIIESDQYKTECTLRFPRVEKIRYDKPWFQCMTIEELEDQKQKAGGKLTGNYAGLDDDDEPKKKRRKITTRHVKPTVGARFRGVDASSVTKVSEMLAGKEICVVNGTATHTKSDLEKKIIEFGGTIVQNPGEETYCVLADKVVIKVKNIISKGVYDVVKATWFIKCINEKKFIPWVPSDMLHTSKLTAKTFAEGYDRHGDSYTQDTTVEQLKRVFKKIDEEKSAMPISAEDIAETEDKYFPQESSYGLFRLARIYLDENLVLGDDSTHIKACSLELVGLELRFHGAILSSSLTNKVTHVVVDSRDISRVGSLRAVNRKREKKFHIVTEKWVCECIEAEKILKERGYEPA